MQNFTKQCLKEYVLEKQTHVNSDVLTMISTNYSKHYFIIFCPAGNLAIINMIFNLNSSSAPTTLHAFDVIPLLSLRLSEVTKIN